ncbi:MAG: bifunctional nicotinamide-nucleotide adenylyltransferase/Nudix hydroxylase [Gallionella sp.]|nr:bifunctional nicotinamide-nucleotide adenylyltransferase/Nudix hydroxylase [Gallionella sp.]
MNNKTNFDIAVLIGRFQPFHKGHQALLNLALQSAARVIVILGSSHQARNAKNPFTWQERAAMIASTLDESGNERVSFVPVRDYYDDKLWRTAVNCAVNEHCNESRCNIALVGFNKDASSYYLTRFPDWSFIELPKIEQIDATSARQIYFESDTPTATQALLSGLLPAAVVAYLNGWMRLPHFAKMKREHLAIEEGKRRWGIGPFITVDAVVTVSDHVLLVQRGGALGHGLWAVPGGFLEPQENLLQGAIRELKEETGLSLFYASLEDCLKEVAVFDHPERSLRGRTITHAHWFDLGSTRLPQVAGADDAADAKWIQIADLPTMEAEFFEDHFRILKHFLKITER